MQQISFVSCLEAYENAPVGGWQRSRLEKWLNAPAASKYLFRIGPPSKEFSTGNLEKIPVRLGTSALDVRQCLSRVSHYLEDEVLGSDLWNEITPLARHCVNGTKKMLKEATDRHDNNPDSLYALAGAIFEADVCIAVLGICDAFDSNHRRERLSTVHKDIESLNIRLAS